MRRVWIPSVCLVVALASATRIMVARADAPMKANEFFEKSVRPILANNCFECHGPKKQKSGLRLDSRDGMLTGGDTGPAIVPGHPEQSLLIKAIHYLYCFCYSCCLTRNGGKRLCFFQ